jgi:hypothetical protein
MSLIVTFGKYNGKNISELINDKSYCDWLLKQEWFVSNKKFLKLKNSILGIQTVVENNKYIIGDKSFKTKTDAENYVRELIKTIGVCNSVITSPELFNELMAIVNNHPNKNKIKNIIDFRIINNKLNKNALELNIIKEDGTIEDISWKSCISGKHKTHKQQLQDAYRYSVDEQIYNYKQSVPLDYCSLCCNECIMFGGVQIDHVIHFEKLYRDFQNQINIEPPVDFDEASDGSNRRMFKKCDSDYEIAWQEYHKKNGVLRVLCRDCNLKREKYNECS